MKAVAETELLEISRKLSPKNRREWLNYGRTLTTQTEKNRRWWRKTVTRLGSGSSPIQSRGRSSM